MHYKAIILAAGQGKRMQAKKNKLLLYVSARPIISHTLYVFEKDEWCKEIILVVSPQEAEEMKKIVRQFHFQKVRHFIAGGSERQFSVANGMKVIHDEDIVLIHDGARPFVKKDHLHACAIKAHETGAAVLAVRVKDTIKKGNESYIEETLDRSSLWAMQTPQAFRGSLIKEALKKAADENYLGTDDASLVEKLGRRVAIVEGDYFNIKITTKEDLLFAEAILAHFKKDGGT